MRLLDRVKRLEKVIHKTDNPLRVAIRHPDGRISWDAGTWEDENSFTKALDKAFKDRPQNGVPRVVIVTFHREVPIPAQNYVAAAKRLKTTF